MIQCTSRGLASVKRRDDMALDEVDRYVGGKMKKQALLIASIFLVKLEKNAIRKEQKGSIGS